jgi:hypothetical protein
MCGSVEVTWEPVKSIEEIQPDIKQQPYKENRVMFDFHEYIEESKLINNSLYKLGRKKLPFSGKRSSILSMYIRYEDELRKEVYEQLKNDFTYILGKPK